MARAGAELRLETALVDLSHDGTGFHATLETQGRREIVAARHLVVATGGKSIPKMGASGLAYDIARQFGHALVPPPPRAGAVHLPRSPLCIARGRVAARCAPMWAGTALTRRCCSPIAASPAPRSCKSPASGPRANPSPSTSPPAPIFFHLPAHRTSNRRAQTDRHRAGGASARTARPVSRRHPASRRQSRRSTRQPSAPALRDAAPLATHPLGHRRLCAPPR